MGATTKETLKVHGMSCGHCVAAVQKELLKVDGVVEAQVTLNPGQAVVCDQSKADRAALIQAVERAGYG